ncbi:FadR family transcriptional regulator [Kibdelosporangium philippinense]|uniref:FadR family transcriptional regulator n=1 Tax=Kibdelosporangium philippinense TaxID=211113 RepID=A0ABS8Z911_9PSEU|nr:FadR/GntR family transcriptional regulator [Kibdelosporangium philippinense]MCE7004356.1 FadR family transcriptional regulator [Kibdelosporangium philippinense]
MAFKRVERRSVPDEVYEQLLADVVGGELAPGKNLPAERQLAEVLGVSRPAVREALQRLAHSGLLAVRQGDGTTVLDYRKHAGLDLLPRLLIRDGELDFDVIRSIVEARLLIGQEVAALAAERSGEDLKTPLQQAIAELAAATDPVTQQRCALVYWEHIVDAADSIVFRLMFNNLRAAYEPAIDALATVLSAEVSRVDSYRDLAEAITSGDGTRAKQSAAKLLRLATDEMLTVINNLVSG